MSIKQPPPHPIPLFLMGKIKMDEIPYKINWKIHTLCTLWDAATRYIFYFLLFYVAHCEMQPPDISFISCCFILDFISADIIFHWFLELHTTSEKKTCVVNFPFLTDSVKVTPPTYPLTCRSPPSMTKVFCQCFLRLKNNFTLWHEMIEFNEFSV